MYKENRLPQNAKEGILFILIISFLSVNTIAPIIMGFEKGFSVETYVEALKILPIMFIIVILLVNFVAGPIVGKVMPKFVGQSDGFNARVLLNTVLNVTVLSICLTIIGSWVGTHSFDLAPFETFFQKWPRNFGTAFWIEILFAQPIARFVMKKMHENQQTKAQQA